MRHEQWTPEQVGPFDVEIMAGSGLVAVPELPDAVANLASAGLLEQILTYDTEGSD